MKIKQVCERTGLTDRAIRYYIEEGLLSPSHTENYMGRRAYDFTDADVDRLNDVATLRKFGFMVEEIRLILADPQESVGIVAAVRQRKEKTLRQEGENLAALTRLEAARAYTLAELAEALAEPVREVEVPDEDNGLTWKMRLGRAAWYAAVMVTGLLPVVMLTLGLMAGSHRFHYPVLPKHAWLSGGYILLPTIALGGLWLLKRREPGRLRTGLLCVVLALCCLSLPLDLMCLSWCLHVSEEMRRMTVALSALAAAALAWGRPWQKEGKVCSRLVCAVLVLCVLHLPGSRFGAGMMVGRSETSEVWAYRKLDISCELNNDTFYQALFPAETGKNASYHYFYETDFFSTYDVTVEWTLPPDELAAEAARVTRLFEQQGDFTCFRQGGFVCLTHSWYGQVDTMTQKRGDQVMAFACNEQTGQVRYIAYYSDAGYDPYYLALDWGAQGENE